LNRREALKLIRTKLEEGSSKQQVYEELLPVFHSSSALLSCLAMVPEPKKRQKYMVLNIMFFCLLLYCATTRFIYGIVFFGTLSFWLLPLSLLFPALSAFFAIMVLNFRGDWYRSIGFFTGLNLFFSIVLNEPFRKTEGLMPINELLFSLLPVAIIMFLSYYLSFKVFPEYKLFGPLIPERLGIKT